MDQTVSNRSPIYSADAVIIDEVSMLRIDVFEYIVNSIEIVNRLRKSGIIADKTEAPIPVILIGDFFQLPPYFREKRGDIDIKKILDSFFGYDVGQGFAFLAPGWKRLNLVTFELSEVKRQSNTKVIAALNQLREGDRSAIPYILTRVRKKDY